MKAVVQERYGAPDEVLELRDLPEPEPGPGEVRVRVRATSVAGDDWHLMRGLPYVARLESGLRRPKRRIPGQDLAGVVDAVGPGTSRWRAGDEVFGWSESGAFAEAVVVPEAALAARPARLTPEQAAALPICGLTALQALRDRGEVRPGQRVLVNGAAGGVGTLAIQIARDLGAVVTGVCSAANAALVRELGAGDVVDYSREDFTRLGRRWDVIVDLAGSRTVSDCRRALTPGGTLVLVGGRGGRLFMGTDRFLRALALSVFVRHRLRPLIHQKRSADLETLADMARRGTLTPVVGRVATLEEVAAAVSSLEAWHSRGKIIVTPAPVAAGG